MEYGTPTTIPANQPKPVMTLIRSDTQQLMKAFVSANPIIPANIRPTFQPTQATSTRDRVSFVANVAVVANLADVTFEIGINISRELPEHGRKGQYCHAERSEASRPRETDASLRSAWLGNLGRCLLSPM